MHNLWQHGKGFLNPLSAFQLIGTTQYKAAKSKFQPIHGRGLKSNSHMFLAIAHS